MGISKSETCKWPDLEPLKQKFPYFNESVLKTIKELSVLTRRQPEDLIRFMIKEALAAVHHMLTGGDYSAFVDIYCKDFGKEIMIAYSEI